MVITLDVQSDKIDFFMELIKNFKFIKVKKEPVSYDGDSREEIIANLKEAATEYKKVKEGKAQTTSLEDFLKELNEL